MGVCRVGRRHIGLWGTSNFRLGVRLRPPFVSIRSAGKELTQNKAGRPSLARSPGTRHLESLQLTCRRLGPRKVGPGTVHVQCASLVIRQSPAPAPGRSREDGDPLPANVNHARQLRGYTRTPHLGYQVKRSLDRLPMLAALHTAHRDVGQDGHRPRGRCHDPGHAPRPRHPASAQSLPREHSSYLDSKPVATRGWGHASLLSLLTGLRVCLRRTEPAEVGYFSHPIPIHAALAAAVCELLTPRSYILSSWAYVRDLFMSKKCLTLSSGVPTITPCPRLRMWPLDPRPFFRQSVTASVMPSLGLGEVVASGLRLAASERQASGTPGRESRPGLTRRAPPGPRCPAPPSCPPGARVRRPGQSSSRAR